MHYRRTHRDFTPEALADIRQRYVETDEPQQSIANDYSVHRKTIDQVARRQEWPRRKERRPRDVPEDLKLAKQAVTAVRAVGKEAVAPGSSRMSAAERAALADRLERQVEQQLAELERRQAIVGNEVSAQADADRAARIVGRLTETLHKVRHLRSPDMTPADGIPACDIPKDIDEFRHRLARRMRDFVRSRIGDRLPDREDEPCRADSSQR